MLMSLVVATVISLGVVRPGIAQVSLDGILQKYLTTYDLPALAAAVVRNGKVTCGCLILFAGASTGTDRLRSTAIVIMRRRTRSMCMSAYT